MSADREIVRQMEEMPGSEISDSSDQAFPRNRYPQRLRRRSTELFQFTQIEAFHEAVPNEGSRPESSKPTAGNKTGVFVSLSQIFWVLFVNY